MCKCKYRFNDAYVETYAKLTGLKTDVSQCPFTTLQFTYSPRNPSYRARISHHEKFNAKY